MKKKIISLLLVLFVLLVIGLAFIEVMLEAIREADRLGLILATKDMPIPAWVKAWIWGCGDAEGTL